MNGISLILPRQQIALPIKIHPMLDPKPTSLFATAEVLPATDTQSGWVGLVLRELGASQATGFMLDLINWTFLGALAGTALAVLAGMLFSRLKWYDFRWRFARRLRWTIFTLTVLLAAILVGLAGFWNGAICGSERVLAKSQLATDVFPKIGEAIADGMAWIQLRASPNNSSNTVASAPRLDDFRAGKWELNAVQFLTELDTFRKEAVADLVAKLEQSALERTPQLKGGIGEKLLHIFLNGLGRLLLEKKVSSELKNYGADRVYLAIRERLTTEAAKAGQPDTISRGQISTFLVREGIVPGILNPIRSTARAQQLLLIGIAILAIMAPPLCIRFVRSRFDKTPSSIPPGPPGQAQASSGN
jgi:hypothetical protein